MDYKKFLKKLKYNKNMVEIIIADTLKLIYNIIVSVLVDFFDLIFLLYHIKNVWCARVYVIQLNLKSSLNSFQKNVHNNITCTLTMRNALFAKQYCIEWEVHVGSKRRTNGLMTFFK